MLTLVAMVVAGVLMAVVVLVRPCVGVGVTQGAVTVQIALDELVGGGGHGSGLRRVRVHRWLRSVALQRDRGPNRLDYAEGPGAREEATLRSVAKARRSGSNSPETLGSLVAAR
jgi:hypothetical protein